MDNIKVQEIQSTLRTQMKECAKQMVEKDNPTLVNCALQSAGHYIGKALYELSFAVLMNTKEN